METETIAPPASKSLERSLLSSMSALGVALGVERGAGFIGNVLAARIASSQTFGAYSLGLTTAMNVAIYAGAGIGSTANRFVSQYRAGTANYSRFLRSLFTVCCSSAILAAAILWFFSETIAVRLLHNPALTVVMRASALFAGAFIALECYRGLLVGQRSSRLLVTLSIMVGLGVVIAIPLAATFGPGTMLVSQSAMILTALLIGMVLHSRQKQADVPIESAPDSPVPSVLNLWRFGLVQLGGVVGLNAAGWWTASLVASADSSLVQMALYSISGQLRNMVVLVPSLVAQSGLTFLTDENSSEFGGTTHVLGVSTMFAQGLAIAASGLGVGLLPWVLHFLYGTRYLGADFAGSLAIVTAVVHAGSSPGAMRLVVISLRATTVINFIWAVFVIGAGSWIVPSGGAVAGTAVMFAAHILSMILILAVLRHKNELGRAVAPMSAISICAALSLAAVGWARASAWVTPWVALALCVAITGLALLQLMRKAHSRDLTSGLREWPGARHLNVFMGKPVDAVAACITQRTNI